MANNVIIKQLEKDAFDMRINILKMCCEIEGPMHIGGDLSIVDIMTALFKYKLNINPDDAKMPSRDRFILSKGHCAAAMYVIMAMCGFFDMDELCHTYGKLDSKFGMHPCKERLPELECSSGSLGHGLSIGVGKALAAKIDNESYRTYVLLGDGELQEGSNWEAAMSAAYYKLGNLVAVVDNNKLQLDGCISDVMEIEPLKDKWLAFGWNVMSIDGHNMNEIVTALDKIPSSNTTVPTVIICRTVKGKGVSFMENQPQWHAGSIDESVLEKCIADLKETYEKGE